MIDVFHTAGSAEDLAPDKLLGVDTGLQQALDQVDAVALECGILGPDGLCDLRHDTGVRNGLDILCDDVTEHLCCLVCLEVQRERASGVDIKEDEREHTRHHQVQFSLCEDTVWALFSLERQHE